MLPGPQSTRGTRPIDTAPTAALPINVSTTRRERFMVAIPFCDCPERPGVSITCGGPRKRKPDRFTASCGESDQPPEKPTACANEPKPPRVTWLDPASEVPDDRLARRGAAVRSSCVRHRSRHGCCRMTIRAAGTRHCLQQRRLRHVRRRLAIVARHQRVGGAADRKRAHQQQPDVTGALGRRAGLRDNRYRRLARPEFPAGFGGLGRHGQ